MGKLLGRRERIAWLRLARTPGVGALTFHRLIARFGAAQTALDALPALIRGRPLAPPPADAIERELERLEAMQAEAVASCEAAYPPLVAALPAPPPVLYIRGRRALLTRPTIAIVGSREASAIGLRMADILARDLVGLGYVVVSGLARGVDAAAHQAALESGTVAVLAGGLDRPYPPQNEPLYARIAAQGCAVCEAPLGAQARARDFPRRNHIISGLALGVVVVEAAQRSGSLITARAAADQGREVMAVPGSPLDPRARGANALIRQGAALVETAEDVVAALGAAATGRTRADKEALTPLFAPEADADHPDLNDRLARAMGRTPIHLNDLARALGVSVAAAAGALTELELEGRAASLPGGYAASPSAAFPESP